MRGYINLYIYSDRDGRLYSGTGVYPSMWLAQHKAKNKPNYICTVRTDGIPGWLKLDLPNGKFIKEK